MTPAKKIALELVACDSVAAEINRRNGTDFAVQKGQNEPADVIFVSRSRKWPSRDAQVVSVPRDIHHRDDNQNLERIRRVLEDALNERRVHGVFVGVLPDANAVEHRVNGALIDQIADLILARADGAGFRITYEELLETAPEVADYFHQIIVRKLSNEELSIVEVPGPRRGVTPGWALD